MKKLLYSLFILVLTEQLVYAQQARPGNSSEIYHEISQLNKLVNVLYMAAHPDDENTKLLAWLVNEQHVRTGYLSLTRGDGGQNILGSEQGAALGLIRTHELLEARKLDGAEQYFTRAIDFGFSKNSDETFKHWDADLLTGDAVWVFRKFRPDIIICRFPPTAAAGHGQHAASAIIAEKAFNASGDKNRYPQQLNYFPAWKAKRLLLNGFGVSGNASSRLLVQKIGQYSPEKGMGLSELAGKSRSIHKSQGEGTPSVPGLQNEQFSLVAGDPASSSIFDGLDITWNRVNRKDIGDKIDRILKLYDFKHPDASLPDLIALRKEISTVKDTYWRNQKLAELNQIIEDCSGLMAEVFTYQPEAVAGTSLPFTVNFISRSATPVKIRSVKWPDGEESINRNSGNDLLISWNHPVTIPASAAITEPYWLSDAPRDAGHYSIPDIQLSGFAEAPNTLNALITISIGTDTFTVRAPLSYKKLDPLKGDVTERLRILPAVTLGFISPLVIAGNDLIETKVHVHTYKDITNGILTVTAADAKPVDIGNISLRAYADTIIPIQITAPKTSGNNNAYPISASFKADNAIFNKDQHVIRYEHIPTLQYFTPSGAKVLPVSWKVTARHIGYIQGAGDFTAAFLNLAGLSVDILKESDFTDAAKLSVYDAIICGVRVINTEKRMPYWLPVLHQYVKNGGTLIMQYNTLKDMSTTNIGPYPFSLSSLRVTEEDAKVTFLNPGHRLLHYPNEITAADFNGWVQELGTYFASDWDKRYEPLFEMHDTGEQPLQGATLVAKYGKGNFINTSLAFFRQLPAGNPGAIRLMMNMLSAGK